MSNLKETCDVLVAVGDVAVVVIKHFKKSEGVGKEVMDIVGELVAAPEFKVDLANAVAGIGEIPKEIASFNLLADVPVIAVAGWKLVDKILGALKA